MLKKRLSNYKLILLLCGYWFSSFSHISYSHEFWLQPKDYTIKPNSNIEADLKVGQEFVGQTLPFFDSNFKLFTINTGQLSESINSRFGSMPAVIQKPLGEGLNILAYVSSYSTVTYESYETFISFLKKEGIEWVIDAHKKRKLPDNGFTEAYQRFVKSLVAVGQGKGIDKPLGLRFEWVLKQNPYQANNSRIKATLLWEGKPLPNSQAIVFQRHNNTVQETILLTNQHGTIEFQTTQGAEYLVSATNMIEASEELVNSQQAVWHSLWASITFTKELAIEKP